MWRVLISELRQGAALQALTLVSGLSLLLVAWGVGSENVSLHGRPLDPNETWIFFVWMILCSVPLVIAWYWNVSWNRFSPFRMIDSMPLSRVKLNLTRLLSLPFQLSPVVLVWFLHYRLLAHFDRSVTPWLAVAVFFYLLFWSAAALRHAVFWAAMWVSVVLLALAGILGIYAESNPFPISLSIPWVAVVLAVVAVGAGWWVVTRCLPRTAE